MFSSSQGPGSCIGIGSEVANGDRVSTLLGEIMDDGGPKEKDKVDTRIQRNQLSGLKGREIAQCASVEMVSSHVCRDQGSTASDYDDARWFC